MGAAEQLSSQWRNPGDILSLLLLIGGEVVQNAIAQLFGVYVQPTKGSPRIYLTPVAFSFGWVGYAFTSLASVVGDKQLMPSAPESRSVVINCDSGYTRINRSWLLDRVLHNHELAVGVRPGPVAAELSNRELKRKSGLDEDRPLRVSLRIDIFDLESEVGGSPIDGVWIFGWLTITAQLGISLAPWVLYGDWAIFLVTASGTLFALLTGSLRQWHLEKWPGRRLNNEPRDIVTGSPKMGTASTTSDTAAAVEVPRSTTTSADVETGLADGQSSTPIKTKAKVVCLTRGNGHRHVMVLNGTGTALDVETLATATSDSLPETPWCLAALAVAWMCLLISVAGLKAHSWFLLVIGGLGMVQNVYAGAAPRDAACLGLAMTPRGVGRQHTIIGASLPEWPEDSRLPPRVDERALQSDRLLTHALGPLETIGVRGAIRELEKRFPGAGFALMLEFFPALVSVEPQRYRHRRERQFWEWAVRRRESGKSGELVFEDDSRFDATRI